WDGLNQAFADPAVVAVVVGAVKTFPAGADIREFGKPKLDPQLADIFALLDGAAKPVVSAIDGTALGGGFELALATHYRVAAPTARVGLPEVNLGLLPGGGGTQRAPRLVGPAVALDLMLTGKHVPAAKAQELGLIDAVIEGDLVAGAIALARAKAAEGGPLPIVMNRADKVTGIDPQLFEDTRKKNAGKWKGMVAPFQIVNCVEAATRLGPQEGLQFERDAFKICHDAPSRPAQIHLFFAERAAAKVDGAEGVKPKPIRSVGIIGAGTMGGGIAMACVNAGLPVKLLDSTEAGLEAGLDRVRKNYATSVARGSTTQDKVDAALAKIEPVLDYAAFADVDLVIEAVFEEMSIKHEVFGKLDAICKP